MLYFTSFYQFYAIITSDMRLLHGVQETAENNAILNRVEPDLVNPWSVGILWRTVLRRFRQSIDLRISVDQRANCSEVFNAATSAVYQTARLVNRGKKN